MDFEKGLRIKAMVNEFNQVRSKEGFALITVKCSMFSIGKWSVDLGLEQRGCFFNVEIEEFFDFSRDNGLMFFVGSNQVSPVLYFQ